MAKQKKEENTGENKTKNTTITFKNGKWGTTDGEQYNSLLKATSHQTELDKLKEENNI
ncbi:MAG: hypothetical protein LBU51_00740 [Bacteroidales bacterium]|jgi:hypothetical protein|nr:hypothetical protein [Bacteroidales bacterium]